MTLYLPGSRKVDLSSAKEIGAGAGGMVFEYPGNDAFCFKLYFPPGTPEQKQRYQAMLLHKAKDLEAQGGVGLAWPRLDLTGADQTFRGYVMDRFHGQSLYGLLDPRLRDEVLDRPTWATLLMVAERVARMMARIHHAELVVGDVSPANILVDPRGTVTFIDCDSFQFQHPRKQEQWFPALNRTLEYSSPESISRPREWLTRHHDEFGLAILICQLLMEGEHPYEGVPQYGPAHFTDGNIASATARWFGPNPMVDVPGAVGAELLPDSLGELARRCFVDGHAQPQARPSAAEWTTALREVAQHLRRCERNERHVTWTHHPGCYWCDQAWSGRGEHYPAGRVRQREGRRRPPGPTRWTSRS